MRLYEVEDAYVEYLSSFDDKVLSHKKGNRKFGRKYLGVVLTVNDSNYFVPLSSYKPKFDKMKDGLDFIKITDAKNNYAVININNMIPIVSEALIYFDIADVEDEKYRMLLFKEYEAIRKKEEKIIKNVNKVYNIVVGKRNERLCQRSCDFLLLEKKAKEYLDKK